MKHDQFLEPPKLTSNHLEFQDLFLIPAFVKPFKLEFLLNQDKLNDQVISFLQHISFQLN